MSDAPTATPSIGDVVDATTSATASAAAGQAASQVADSIPEPSSTTVVIEPDSPDQTAEGLAQAEVLRRMAREEAGNFITELVAYDEAVKAQAQPEVVVVTQQAQAPAAPVADPSPEPEVKPDDAPPMARDHPYYRPIRKRKRGGE